MSTNFLSAGPSVGSHAPDFVLTGFEARTGPGEPRVVAFVHDWSFERESPEVTRAIRTQLRGLGALLVCRRLRRHACPLNRLCQVTPSWSSCAAALSNLVRTSPRMTRSMSEASSVS